MVNLHCRACNAEMDRTPDLRGDLCFDCYYVARGMFDEVREHLRELEILHWDAIWNCEDEQEISEIDENSEIEENEDGTNHD